MVTARLAETGATVLLIGKYYEGPYPLSMYSTSQVTMYCIYCITCCTVCILQSRLMLKAFYNKAILSIPHRKQNSNSVILFCKFCSGWIAETNFAENRFNFIVQAVKKINSEKSQKIEILSFNASAVAERIGVDVDMCCFHFLKF